MHKRIYTYALITALYDTDKDYIDCFWPFVLWVLPGNLQPMQMDAIQESIEEQYGLSIPMHSLGVIVTRATRRGLVSRHARRCSLTDLGAKQHFASVRHDDITRRLERLLDDAGSHLSAKCGESFTREETRQLIEAFVHEQVEFFEHLSGPTEDSLPRGLLEKRLLRAHEVALVGYFATLDDKDEELRDTLQDVVCGSIIAAALNSESFPEATKRFEPMRVYLDTNFLFSLLGLHHEQYCKPARELFELMYRDGHFKFRVFDFTIHEMVGVLAHYIVEGHRYPKNLKIGSIYSSLRTKGYSAAAVRKLIATIEDKLRDFKIVSQTTRVDLNKGDADVAEKFRLLSRYKPFQPLRGKRHDLAAIKKVEELRGGVVRQVEQARAIFLTSDRKLARYDYREGRHEQGKTVASVITDRTLTNLLWLKNPTLLKNMPLDVLMAMHASHLFIDRNVWDRFFVTVEMLRKKGEASEEDIVTLLYDQSLEDALQRLSARDKRQINIEWVSRQMGAAKTRVNAERAKELALQERKFKKELESVSRQREREVTDLLLQMRAKLRIGAERRARLLHHGIFLICGALLLGVIVIFGPLVPKYWSYIEPWAWAGGACAWILTWVGGVRLSPPDWKDRIASWCFRRRMRMLGLKELEQEYSDKNP